MSELKKTETINERMSELASIHTSNKKAYSDLSKFMVSNIKNTSLSEDKFDIYNSLVENTKKISSTNNKIRSSIYSINNSLSIISSNDIFKTVENDIKYNSDFAISTANEIQSFLIIFEKHINELITLINNNKPSTSDITGITQYYSDDPLNNKEQFRHLIIERPIHLAFSRLTKVNNEIHKRTSSLIEVINQTKHELIELKDKISEEKEISYIERFKEDTDLLLKKYEINIKNLTNKLENRISSINLSHTELVNSNTQLSANVETTSQKLESLNEKTQNIETEFSKIITTQTEQVKRDLNVSKIELNTAVEEIKIAANTKLEDIEKAHNAFINLVSDAGIYNLTENYNNKAKEEKKQYETYRTYTGRAIGAAIFFTIIILTIPLVEHWGANPAVDINYFTILARLTISLMFFVLALYFSKQASKHYECYQENHRTFLQLAALEPFMANMTAEEKQEIRKSLVPSYFNQGVEGKFLTKGDDVDMSMMFTFMDKLSNFGQNKKDIKPVENSATETKPSV